MDTRISSPTDGAIGDWAWSEAELHALLASHGYVWSVRESGWFECLVSRDRERWRGSGLTAAAALQDAVGQMLPSALARRLATRPRVLVPTPSVLVPKAAAPEVVPSNGAHAVANMTPPDEALVIVPLASDASPLAAVALLPAAIAATPSPVVEPVVS